MIETKTAGELLILGYGVEKKASGEIRKRRDGSTIEYVNVLGQDGEPFKLPMRSGTGPKPEAMSRAILHLDLRTFATTRTYEGNTFADQGRDFEVIGFTAEAKNQAKAA